MRRGAGIVGIVLVTAVAMITGAAQAGAVPGEVTHEDFGSADFTDPTTIDNSFVSYLPGRQLTLEGKVDGEAHRLVITVTDLWKTVKGVRTLVVLEQDYDDGVLAENELAFEAQDDDGNVWNLGEYPEEFEDGAFIGAPSTWIAGQSGARAGVLMRTDPHPGTSSYLEGLAPAIDFEDEATITDENKRTCTPVACYRGVLVIDETDLADPSDGHQLKYYAPGVGNVRVEAIGGESQETLKLVKFKTLKGSALTKIRDQALALDRRGYVNSSDYLATTPARQLR